jgi:ligand-binding SRPBCC domain-containing protein
VGELRHRAQRRDLEAEPVIVWSRVNGLAALETRQWFPHPIEHVFSFFAEAGNLERITPSWLRFQILSPKPISIRKGSRLDYRIRLHGLPVRWQSEITAWDPPTRFVDEQRRGPYRVWIHEHEFSVRDDGTEVRDLVRYAVPGGWAVDRLFVRRDLETIFEHRAATLREILG